jgi:hypothetical protein
MMTKMKWEREREKELLKSLAAFCRERGFFSNIGGLEQ